MLDNIDIYFVFDLFLLLLIGMGPKIALVPYLDLTKGVEPDTPARSPPRWCARPWERRSCWLFSAGC